MVVEKLDPIVGQLFSSYLSNGEESAKRDHGNEFRGSKNGGREEWVGLEWPENTKIRRPKVAVAVTFAGPIRARPEAACWEILPKRSPHRAPPLWPTRVQGWWPVTPPTAKTCLVFKWIKTTQFGVQGFGEFSLGLWSSK